MNTLTGTIIEAGSDCNGIPRITIETTVENLRDLKSLPLYRRAEFTIREIEEERPAEQERLEAKPGLTELRQRREALLERINSECVWNYGNDPIFDRAMSGDTDAFHARFTKWDEKVKSLVWPSSDLHRDFYNVCVEIKEMEARIYEQWKAVKA